MSGEGVLLDSVILIDHLNGIEVATSYLRRISTLARVSAITRAEVLTGFDDSDLPAPRSLLSSEIPLRKQTGLRVDGHLGAGRQVAFVGERR